MNPFRKGRNSGAHRSVTGQKFSRKKVVMKARKARLREGIGTVNIQKSVQCALLNVDGYSDETLVDVQRTLAVRKPDICFLLETKRRYEDVGSEVRVDGYDLHEVRRSNSACDKGGGGLAVYTKTDACFSFKEYNPDITNPYHSFVQNERKWMTIDSSSYKTAFCGVYLGFQADDDRHGEWNEAIYTVLKSEICALKIKGFRIVMAGDFNAHIGCVLGQGVVGNKPLINENGIRFLEFLRTSGCKHINGECRIPGQWETKLTRGLWTRQRGGSSTIIDYGVVSVEHLSSVKSMYIDDGGIFGGGSDHNWIFISLDDKFVKQTFVLSHQKRKDKWDFDEDFDWTSFKLSVDNSVDTCDTQGGVDGLAGSAASILLEAARKNIGVRKKIVKTSMLSKCLPASILHEIEFKRLLERDWKTIQSQLSTSGPNLTAKCDLSSVKEAEQHFLQQKGKVGKLLAERRHQNKSRILEVCSEKTVKAVKCFWSHVNSKYKKSDDIRAVISSLTGTLKCNPDDIRDEVAIHLLKVFQGSFDPIPVVAASEHSYCAPTGSETPLNEDKFDHSYVAKHSPCLPMSDGSETVESDPTGWMDKKFVVGEIKKAVSLLQNCKAVGLDRIPNEFLKNAGAKFFQLLTVLYNKVKESGIFPIGWNAGRVCLVHKRGEREKLGNYRPLTVIVSMSGLYSRLLNERLVCVVEQHHLLGEVQNGFRKGRRGADNTFILDTILWKAKSKKQKVHLGFVDITKVIFFLLVQGRGRKPP